MNAKMTVELNDGTQVECNVVAKWSNKINNYLAYTDGTLNDGKLELFVSKFISDKGTVKLIDITDEEEWKYVNSYLEENLFSEDDFDE